LTLGTVEVIHAQQIFKTVRIQRISLDIKKQITGIRLRQSVQANIGRCRWNQLVLVFLGVLLVFLQNSLTFQFCQCPVADPLHMLLVCVGETPEGGNVDLAQPFDLTLTDVGDLRQVIILDPLRRA